MTALSSVSTTIRMGLLKLLGRVALSVFLLWLLFENVDSEVMLSSLGSISLWDLSVIVILLTLGSCANALRWQVVLRTLGYDISSWAVARLVFVGLFFNQVLPSSIGGDAIRGYYITNYGVTLGNSATSILIDRLNGLLAMIILTVLGWIVLIVSGSDIDLLTIVALLFLSSTVGLVLLLAMDRFPSPGWMPASLAHVRSFSMAARRMTFSRPGLSITAFSLIGQLLTVAAFIVIGAALDIDVGTYVWFGIIPPILIATILPISLAGWGLREGMIVFALAAYSINMEIALVASVLFGLAQIARSLPGGLLWLLGERHRPPQMHEQMPGTGH